MTDRVSDVCLPHATDEILATCHGTVLYLNESGALRHGPLDSIDHRRIIYVRRGQAPVVIARKDATSAFAPVVWAGPEKEQAVMEPLFADLIIGGFVQLRGADWVYVSAGFSGSVVRDRTLARHWETFSLLNYNDALHTDLIAAQRRLIDSAISHGAGESEKALRELNEALEHNRDRPAFPLIARQFSRQRATILTDLGRWAQLADIAGPLWDFHGSDHLQSHVVRRAGLDGIAVAEPAATPDPAWIGLSKLANTPAVQSAEARIHRLGSTRSRRTRAITLPRKLWPDETGGIVNRARLIGGLFICYAAEPGVIKYAHRDNALNARGGMASPPPSMDIRVPTDRVAGLSILVGGSENYFHNITEYLINYFYVQKYSALWSLVNPPASAALAGAILILLKQDFAFHDQIVELLDIDKSRIYYQEDRQTILCDRLVLLPQAISGIGVVRDSSAVRWLQAQISRKVGPPGPPRRLYISRNDATKRRVVNEDQVRGLVERYGFEFVQLTGLPVARQFEMFRDAQVVMGPHGAGFTNLIATMRACTLVEFLPIGPPKWSYYVNLTEGLGHRHVFFDSACLNDDHDMMVDIPALERLIEDIT